ncbi:MAG: response regulator transcription factor [Saprospiraceae bacterium]
MKILVIEDEKGIANFIQQGLEEEAYEVDTVDHGQRGLEMAMQQNYDLFLVDWMLPGLSGIEICQKLRAAKINTPLIFLTAKVTTQNTVEGLRAGANDYIKKPFHFEELLARIKVQLRKKINSSEQLILGNITLDQSAHQVYQNGTAIAFTQKEFALLEYLILHKGKVCTRREIIRQVWDIHFEYDTGIIDVYINAIRKKLQLNKETDPIQTVRGVGYLAKA